jgi:hypothetical protein
MASTTVNLGPVALLLLLHSICYLLRGNIIEEKMPFNSPPNRLDDVQAFIELKLWHLLC